MVHVLAPGTETRAARRGSDRAASRAETASTPTRGSWEPPRVGFVVSKAVGVAVVRHRVARRLRHLMRERLARFPAGTLVVVRALPPAAKASSRDLGTDLDAAFRKLRVLVAEDERPPTGSMR